MWSLASAVLGVFAALSVVGFVRAAELGPDMPPMPLRPFVSPTPGPRPFFAPRPAGPFNLGRIIRLPPPDYRVYAPGGDARPPLSAPTAQPYPPRGRICFDQAETRENITAHGLTDPQRAVRFGRSQGETLSAKLCRWRPDEFVYEVHVLRHDGRVLRVFMNAQSGEVINGPYGANREPVPK